MRYIEATRRHAEQKSSRPGVVAERGRPVPALLGLLLIFYGFKESVFMTNVTQEPPHGIIFANQLEVIEALTCCSG